MALLYYSILSIQGAKMKKLAAPGAVPTDGLLPMCSVMFSVIVDYLLGYFSPRGHANILCIVPFFVFVKGPC